MRLVPLLLVIFVVLSLAVTDPARAQPSSGDCCTPHGSTGCATSSCEACVCALDSFCCTNLWDRPCVDKAEVECLSSCPSCLTCSTTPETGCRLPTVSQKSLLLIKDRLPDTKDKLVWKWLKGAATTIGDFGDPLTDTTYELCVYDQTGGSPNLVLSSKAPNAGVCAGQPCWKQTASGFKYKDKDLSPNGILGVLLKAGEDGKAKIVVKGKSASLGLPPTLTLTQPITVQIKNNVGTCWEADYSAPALVDQPDQFKDKAD
jgi:hypothetical protein